MRWVRQLYSRYPQPSGLSRRAAVGSVRHADLRVGDEDVCGIARYHGRAGRPAGPKCGGRGRIRAPSRTAVGHVDVVRDGNEPGRHAGGKFAAARNVTSRVLRLEGRAAVDEACFVPVAGAAALKDAGVAKEPQVMPVRQRDTQTDIARHRSGRRLVASSQVRRPGFCRRRGTAVVTGRRRTLCALADQDEHLPRGRHRRPGRRAARARTDTTVATHDPDTSPHHHSPRSARRPPAPARRSSATHNPVRQSKGGTSGRVRLGALLSTCWFA